MAGFASHVWLLLLGAALLLQLCSAHAARQGAPGRGGMARMGGQRPGMGRTVRYRVDAGRRPEKYFADASVVRQRPRSQRPPSSFMDAGSAPVMRNTGAGGTRTVGAPRSEPRTVMNFMNRFRSLLISPINRWTGLGL